MSLLLLVFLAGPAHAQESTAQTPPLPSVPTVVPQDLEYQIGPGDTVSISVLGNPDLSQNVVIQDDGTFLFPLVGRVKGSDMTVKELERKVTTLLGERYIKNPQVTVLLQQYKSRIVYVLGEAGQAGRYSLNDARTILDVAARAGIPNTAQIRLVRPLAQVDGPLLPDQVQTPAEAPSDEQDGADGDGGEEGAEPPKPRPLAEIITVSMREIQAGALDKNLVLKPNDTLFVVQADKVYVSGEVVKPGGYSPPVDATVEQIVLLAGGFTTRASKGRIELEREVEGKRKKVKVKLDDVVQPGDKINVKAKLF